jgi:type IV pilus assembly protein PilW
MNKNILKSQSGLSLVEMMISLGIAMFLMVIALGIFMQETGLYKTTGTQATIQSAENAISSLVAPAVRSAGFMGCASLGPNYSFSYNLNPGVSPPLGTLGTPTPNPTTASGVFGYDALISGAASPLAISENAANDAANGDWSPALDATLIPLVEQGSDVLVVLGPVPGSQPVSVVSYANNSSLQLAANISATDLSYFSGNQWVALSDCNLGTASIFQVTNGVGVAAANPLPYVVGSGAQLTNAAGVGGMMASFLAPPPATVANSNFIQLIPLQQTAFFVAHGNNGQSALMMAVLGANNVWVVKPLVPGVDNMQVLYGVSLPGKSSVQQYVPASVVGNWATVHSVRIGFLLDGQFGSQAQPAPGSIFSTTILGTVVNLPADTRLRHVFEITVNVRNAS